MDDVGDVVDELDDELGEIVARCRLAREDDRAGRAGRVRVGLDAVVEGDDVEHVEELALVFVDALHLHVEEGVRADGDPGVLQHVGREPFLVGPLHGTEGLAEGGVVGQGFELADLFQIDDPVAPDAAGDEFGQPGVGLVEPASRGDAVGDVDELARVELVEVGEQGVLEQLRVELGHAVDGVAADDGEVSHAYPASAFLVDEGEAAQHVHVPREVVHDFFEEAVVDLVDDLQVARQHALEQGHGPGFQRLGHEGVVGVGEGAGDDVPGFLPGEFVLVQQQTHQLGDGDGRVGVVELDGDFLGQFPQFVVVLGEAGEDVLEGGGDEEVLLLEAQFPAHLGGIVGIEHLGEVLGFVLVGHGLDVVALVEIFEVEVPARLGGPQAQVVHGVGVVARYGDVVGHGHDVFRIHPLLAQAALGILVAHHPAVEFHREEHAGAGKLPGVAVTQPVVGVLDLVTVLDALVEHAVVVADAIAVAR